jgi:hypothetical protein
VRELCLQRNLTPAQTEVECLVLSLMGFSGERLKELQERLIAVRAFFTRVRGLPPRALRMRTSRLRERLSCIAGKNFSI